MAWLQILALTVMVFAIQLAVPGVTQLLAFTPANALSAPWTFVTALFTHHDIMHLFFNMWALYLFGSLLESRIGEKRFYALYFLSGIVGNLAFSLFYPANTMGLGASGAVYGVLGALAVLMPNLLVLVLVVPLPLWLASIAWIVMEFLSSGSGDAIAHGVHLAGIFVGLAWGRRFKQEFPEYGY